MSRETPEIPEFLKPTVRGEEVEVIGPKPEGWTGLNEYGGDILVRYPDGEVGAVTLSDIRDDN